MIACVDVDYRNDVAVAGCVIFREWTDAEPLKEYLAVLDDVEPYRPGQFYLRELPCILNVLEKVVEPITMILVDGYVWLDTSQKAGLGAKLYEALEKSIPVIGVAKSSFPGSAGIAVLRGKSVRPLWVTAVGIELDVAVQHIQEMHGVNRIPTLLKRVDSLCRAGVLR